MFGNNQNNNQQQSEKKTKVFNYCCVENCTFEGVYYGLGDIISLPEKKEVPHFKFVEEVKVSDK